MFDLFVKIILSNKLDNSSCLGSMGGERAEARGGGRAEREAGWQEVRGGYGCARDAAHG